MPKGGVPSQQLTTVYYVLLRLASTNWLPSVNTHLVSKKMAVLLYKIRNMIDVDLSSIIFSHIMTFTKKKETKVHLPFPSLIFGILKGQGFEPYNLENNGDYFFYPRLSHGKHYDDRFDLNATPVPDGTVHAASAPVSPIASRSYPVRPASSRIPVEPPVLISHRQLASSIKSSMSLIRGSIASQQDAAAGLIRTESSCPSPLNGLVGSLTC